MSHEIDLNNTYLKTIKDLDFGGTEHFRVGWCKRCQKYRKLRGY